MMTKMDYFRILVDEIHSTTVATIGFDGHPQTRIIDMMCYDKNGVYFLTARGKVFYDQLMKQQYVAISATKNKIAVSLRGKVKNIGKKNLDIMFNRNTVFIAEDVQKFVRSIVLRRRVYNYINMKEINGIVYYEGNI